MSDPIARWHDEHVNFGRLLDLLDRELARFHDGAAPSYELMLDVMYYMTHYPDVFHHPVEDLAFDRIRALDAAVAPVLQKLSEQHAALRRQGEALVELLDDIVNGAIRTRESVESAAKAYVECFRKHMATEDSAVFPAASKVLSDTDWAEITARFNDGEDPLFGASVAARYAALDEQISREATIAHG